MRRWRRIGVSTVAAVVLLVGVLVAGLWVGGNTAAGRRMIEGLTYRLTAGSVELQGLGGSFPMQPTLEHLTLRDARGVWLSAEGIALRWRPFALLTDTVSVDAVTVRSARMTRLPVGSGKKGGPVSIPVIDVRSFAIARADLGPELTGKAAALTGHGAVHLRSIADETIDVQAQSLEGNGHYDLALRFDAQRLEASLDVREPAGGPLENLIQLPGLGALAATVKLTGPRTAERLDLELHAGELAAQAKGLVDLSTLSGDADFAVTSPALRPRADLAWRRIALSGRWHGDLKTPVVGGEFDLEGLALPGSTGVESLHAAVAAKEGAITLKAALTGLTLPGSAPDVLRADPVTLDASMRLNEPSLPFTLNATHRLFALRARGTAGAGAGSGAGQRATLDADLPDLSPLASLAHQALGGHASLKATVERDPQRLRLTLDGDAALTGSPPWIRALGEHITVHADAAMTDGAVAVDRLQLVGPAAEFAASGSLQRKAGGIGNLLAHWDLTLPDLAAVSPGLVGTASASGDLKGPAGSLDADAHLETTVSVHDSAVGTVQADLRAHGLPAAPSGTLRAHGSLDGAPLTVDVAVERGAAGSFDVAVRDIDWKTVRVEGEVAVGATEAQNHGQLRLKVERFSDFDRLLGTPMAGSADGLMAVDTVGGRPHVSLELSADDVAVRDLKGNLHFTGEGPIDAIGLKLDVRLPEFKGAPASLTAAASLHVEQHRLQLAQAVFDYRGQAFSLQGPATLDFADGIVLDQLTLGAREAGLSVAGRFSPTLDLTASLRDVRADIVDVFLPGVMAGGNISGAARLSGTAASPTGDIRLDATGLTGADDSATGLPAIEAHAHAVLANDTAQVDAQLSAGAKNSIQMSGSMPLNAHGTLDVKISGQANVALANPLFEARGQHAAGDLSVRATVTGAPGDPEIGGTITLAHGAFRDYGRGVDLTDIDADVVGGQGLLRIQSFSAKAGAGTLAMSGTWGVLQPGWPLDLTLTAKNAQPIASTIITAKLDADLTIHGLARQQITVAGTIRLNRTVIGIPDSLPPDVAVLDVHRRGQKAPITSDKHLVVDLDLLVQAPQQMIVRGRGLDAELAGDLHIAGTAEAPLVSGGFDLTRGTFSIAGSTLDFTSGRVSFDGTGLQKKIDPSLDFQAKSTVSNATVSNATVYLTITGYADAPKFEFSSDQPLQQDEIMSLLLFGEPASQLSPFQLAEVGAALASLGSGSGALNPIAKLQKTLGLDKLSVGANTVPTATGGTTTSGAQIQAGRYLSKRIYVEGKQTTTGTSQVEVDVDLTKHFKLQTRLGNGSAITQGTTPENDPGSSIGFSYGFEY
jgi:translocation and assembly module TamB